MKRFILFLTALVCLSNVVKAQTVEVYKNGRLQIDVLMADSVNFTPTVIPTSEEARDWAYANLDSLVNVVWEQMQASDEPNKRDPDATREVFRTIGYNGKNVVTYLQAGAVVDSVIMERLIDKAVAEGNHSAVLIAGNSGGGKSYSIKVNPGVQKIVKEAGVVLDEVFSDKDALCNTLAYLKEKGIDDQTVVLVHNDAITSMKNAFDRYMRSGRIIGLNFFLYLYNCYDGYVKYLEDNNVGTRRFYIENEKNSAENEKSNVDVEHALKWDYKVTTELKQELCTFMYDYFIENKDKITPRDVWAMIFDE